MYKDSCHIQGLGQILLHGWRCSALWQVQVYNSPLAGKAGSDEEQYHVALALLTTAFCTYQPAHIETAMKLLEELDQKLEPATGRCKDCPSNTWVYTHNNKSVSVCLCILRVEDFILMTFSLSMNRAYPSRWQLLYLPDILCDAGGASNQYQSSWKWSDNKSNPDAPPGGDLIPLMSLLSSRCATSCLAMLRLPAKP